VATDATQVRREVESFLDTHHVMGLATVAADGSAHAASLFYARDGLALVWTSAPSARHSQHLDAGDRVTATVAPDVDDFRAVRGLQIAGRARRLQGRDEADHASRLLRARYPFLDQFASLPLALATAFHKAAFYRLTPETVTLIDNHKGFGHKDTLRVRSDGGVELVA